MNDFSPDPSLPTAEMRYEVLRGLALSAAEGRAPADLIRDALERAGEIIGLSAARLFLWDDSGRPTFDVSFALAEQDRNALAALEEQIFAALRMSRHLRTAYLTFGSETPLSAFTIPLSRAGKTLGAVVGVRRGEARIMREDVFLETLAAALIVSALVSGVGTDTPDANARIQQARQKAVSEITATVNHEINNPLTAALGNVQLLLMRRDQLEPDLRRKLEIIERSALQIRDVTQRLMLITEPKSTTYVGDDTMIDLGAKGGTSPDHPAEPE